MITLGTPLSQVPGENIDDARAVDRDVIAALTIDLR